jgi:hypothetical protein
MSLYNKAQLSDLIEKIEKFAMKKEADASFLSFLPVWGGGLPLCPDAATKERGSSVAHLQPKPQRRLGNHAHGDRHR